MEMKNLEETDANSKLKCQICNIETAKYTCPKCNAPYCSVLCYKSETHNECSETFYRDSVMAEMSSQAAESDDPKKTMFDILQRCSKIQDPSLDEMLASSMDYNDQCEIGKQYLDSDDDEPDLDLGERMEGVDFDDPDQIWEKLTKEERDEFEKLVTTGDIEQCVPRWTPWWTLRAITAPIIQDLDYVEDYSYREYCPKWVEIPDFDTISKHPPSEQVPYNILNVISAFVYTMITYNGDHLNFVTESVYLLQFISNNLKNGTNYSDPLVAINDIIQEASRCCLIIFDRRKFACIPPQCQQILNGPNLEEPTYYSLSALSEIYRMIVGLKRRKLQKARQKRLEQESRRRSQEPKVYQDNPYQEDEDPDDDPAIQIQKDKLKLLKKKIEYYLAYVKKFGLRMEICK